MQSDLLHLYILVLYFLNLFYYKLKSILYQHLVAHHVSVVNRKVSGIKSEEVFR